MASAAYPYLAGYIASIPRLPSSTSTTATSHFIFTSNNNTTCSCVFNGISRLRHVSNTITHAKFEKFQGQGQQLEDDDDPQQQSIQVEEEEEDDDSCLPSDLEDAVRQSGQASAEFVSSGVLRAISVKAIFLDAGAAALLKYQWKDAAFGFSRPFIMWNPRLVSEDIGVGINVRWLRQNFLSTFAVVYSMKPLLNDAVFRCYPGVSCRYDGRKNADSDDEPLTTSSAYCLLGLNPQCSSAQLKAAFRTKVKQFHPDVTRDDQNSDIMIRRVIQAYEILSNYSKSEIIERECMDPFDQPECEAFDLFVNEILCIGKGCPYSCVNNAPHAFKFSSVTGTARATSQGHAEDYQIQFAVSQCPRSCIHYVTPSQRIILEELLHSILNRPYDTSAEAELLYSMIVKASYENNRYQNPKKNAKVSSKHVDWF